MARPLRVRTERPPADRRSVHLSRRGLPAVAPRTPARTARHRRQRVRGTRPWRIPPRPRRTGGERGCRRRAHRFRRRHRDRGVPGVSTLWAATHRHRIRPQRDLWSGGRTGHGVHGRPDQGRPPAARHRRHRGQWPVRGPPDRRARRLPRSGGLPGSRRGRRGSRQRRGGRWRPGSPGQHGPVPRPGRRHRRPGARNAPTGSPRHGRVDVHVQRPGFAALRRCRSRRRGARPGGRPGPPRRVLRRGGVRPDRRHQLRPQLHRLDRPVPRPLAGGRADRNHGRALHLWPIGFPPMTEDLSSAPDLAPSEDLEQLGINVIRGLAMDAPRAANSGHPGTAMALAPLAHVLFTRVMRHDPSDPLWPDRDRFVLSNGHASILLYSMLYLTGYGLERDDLRSFREWGSRTPGHPELHHTAGVEVTTGPLGQGVANGVGMGIAERWLRSHFSPEVCDHHTYVVAGDGCFEEGISHEAASLAGHLGLGRLVYVYDDNHITIDGPTELSYSDDVAERFGAYGWGVDDIRDVANDLGSLEAALLRAKADDERPSLIILRSHIGYPSPHLTDTAKAHGDPFSPEEIRLTKEILGLPADESFWVPEDVLGMYRRCIPRGQAWRATWAERFAAWDGDKARWEAAQAGHGMPGWEATLPSFAPGDGPIATRKAVKACIDATGASIPGLIPGSADLTGNTGMAMADAVAQSAEEPGGSLIHYGIREHGMGAVMTGMAAHGGLVPVGGTFFVFSDDRRGAVRVAAPGV